MLQVTISYDPKADAISIWFKGESVETQDATVNLAGWDTTIMVDGDKDGKIVGIEILNASRVTRALVKDTEV